MGISEFNSKIPEWSSPKPNSKDEQTIPEDSIPRIFADFKTS